jgi:hypothetical protein
VFKNSFNLKGYGFDVFGTTDLAGFDANIEWLYAPSNLQMHKTPILKCSLADEV